MGCSRPGFRPDGLELWSVTSPFQPPRVWGTHYLRFPGRGSLRTSGHEMNLRANMAQKRSVLNATPANEIGMAGELRMGDWRWPEPPPPASSQHLGALLSKPAYAFPAAPVAANVSSRQFRPGDRTEPLSLAREVFLGLWNQLVIPAGRLLHWAAFRHGPHLHHRGSRSPQLSLPPKKPEIRLTALGQAVTNAPIREAVLLAKR